jgi:hypothetical protein
MGTTTQNVHEAVSACSMLPWSFGGSALKFCVCPPLIIGDANHFQCPRQGRAGFGVHH